MRVILFRSTRPAPRRAPALFELRTCLFAFPKPRFPRFFIRFSYQKILFNIGISITRAGKFSRHRIEAHVSIILDGDENILGRKAMPTQRPTTYLCTRHARERAQHRAHHTDWRTHPHSFASHTSSLDVVRFTTTPNKTSNRRHSPVAAADLARSARSFLHPSPPIFTAIIILSS